MKSYLDILKLILESPYSVHKPTRTGVDTLSLSGVQFEHDMSQGFPLLTTKKMGLKSISAELEFFIKGLSDKKWLQERNCHIWDQWGNPKRVKKTLSNLDSDTIKLLDNNELRRLVQKQEPDLGRIYGVQWRGWNVSDSYDYEVLDQLKDVIDKAKKDPLDRRLLVSAWRPDEFDEMALPPCHYAWQILSDGQYLDLIFMMRSVDCGLGLPYNIASYGLLLLLLAKELNLIPRRLVGQLGDTHIYENHIDGLTAQLKRDPFELPIVKIPDENWKGIFEWQYTDIVLENYKHHDKIQLPIAI